MKKRKFPFIILIVVIVLCGVIFIPDLIRPEERSYSSFVESVESGDVVSVTFDSDFLKYQLKNGERYSTQNPSSPTLKEELLLQDVRVKDDDSSLESMTNVLFNLA